MAPTSSIIPVNMDTRPRFQSEYPRQDGSGCCFSAGMLHSAQELLHLPPVFLLPVRRTALGQCTPAPVEQRRFPVLPSSVSLRLPEECCRFVPHQLLPKVDSKYTLVVLAAKRARQILAGSPVKSVLQSHKDLTNALEEVAEDKITFARVKKSI